METSLFGSLKRLAKHSVVYGIGHIVTRSLGFLLLPLYTNYLPTEEYGRAALIFTFLAFMNVFYTYGMDVAFLRHYVLQEDEESRKNFFSTAYLSVAGVAILWTVLIELLPNTISALIFGGRSFPTLIVLSGGILLFDALAAIPFILLRALEKSVQFTALKLLNVLVNLTANIVLIVYFKKGVEGIFLAQLFTSFFTFLAILPILLKNFHFAFVPSLEKMLLHFGLPYVPSGLAVIIMDLIDRLILDRKLGDAVTGIYSAGYKLGMIMALFVAAFRFAWHPFFLSTSKQENAKAVFSKVLTYFSLGGAAVFLVISLYIDELVRIRLLGKPIFGEQYWSSTVIVPVIMLSYLFYGIYVNFLVGIYLKKKTGSLPFVTGSGAAVNIALNLILIPLIGMLGSAWATFGAYLTMAVLLYVIAQKAYFIPYEWGRLMKIVLAAVVVFFLPRWFPALSGNWGKVFVLILFPVLLILQGFFTREERQAVMRILGRR
jgi:O-antigen/teichoic acid export membrane protein